MIFSVCCMTQRCFKNHISENNTSAVTGISLWGPRQFPRLLSTAVQVGLHQIQPPKMFDFTCMYSTPGRFTIMNTWCGEAVNSAYKITPFLLPVGPGCCLSNEVTSCHVTPPPSQQPTCVDFSLNPSLAFPLLFSCTALWILRLLSVTNSPTQGYCLLPISAFVLPFQAGYSLISLVGGVVWERVDEEGGGAFPIKRP